ncbi:MAG TPA: PilZ domain-containing protein [Polyangia bacterium]|nr:PilZ domain-containing protein [Polyangia bacterium]
MNPAEKNGGGGPQHFRNKARWDQRVKVRYRLHQTGGAAVEQAAFTSNISLRGAFIVTPAPPSPGTAITLILQLPPGGTEIQTEAEVRWVAAGDGETESGMGVRFEGMLPEHLEKLQKFLSELIETLDYDDLA